MTRIDDILEQLRTGTLGATEAMLAIQKRLNESEELDAEDLYRQVDESHHAGLSSARAGRVRELIDSWFAGETPEGDTTDEAIAPATPPAEGGQDSPEDEEFHLELEPAPDPPSPEDAGEAASPAEPAEESETDGPEPPSPETPPGEEQPPQDAPQEELPPIGDPGELEGTHSRSTELPGQLPPGTGDEEDEEVVLEAGGAGELTRKAGDPDNHRPGRTTTTMVGALLGGRYELLSRISQDAYGTMFRARDHKSSGETPDQQLCGIRVLPREANREEVQQRLQAIIRRTTRLDHPGILRPRAIENDGQRTWLVTDAPQGGSLARFIRRKCIQGLKPDEALPMVRKMGEALFAAHKEEILHGDLRPSSIYVATDGNLQIADFGLRVALYGNTTPSGEAGTTEIEQMDPIDAYLTLEILEGEAPEPSDDVYGLACIAASLLTGGHPFNGQSALRRMERDLKPPRIRRLTRYQNRALRRGMALYREQRPGTVLEFLEELETRRGPIPTLKIALAAGLAGVAVAGWLGFQHWSAQQGHAAQLEQIADAGWPAIRGELRALEEADRDRILGELEEDILAAYREGIDGALEDGEPELARSYFEELERWYPDAGELAAIEEELDQARQEQIAALENELGALLDSRELTERDEGRDLPEIVAQLDRLGARPEPSRMDELRAAYRQAAEEAAVGAAPDRAEALLQAASGIFSGDEQLLDELQRAAREAETRASEQQLGEIESAIADQLPPPDLETIDAIRDQLSALIRIGGGHPWLDEHGERITQLLREQLEHRIAAEDFAEANRILRQNAPILPTEAIQGLRRELNRAQSESGWRPPSVRTERQSLQERREAVESLLDDPRYTPPWTGELIVAWRETLAWRRPGQRWVNELEERMGTLFADRAEELLERGDPDPAREMARMGLYLAPGHERLEALAENGNGRNPD